MSKQSDAKETQGFLKDSPKCSNCKNFTFDTEEKRDGWTSYVLVKQKNLRCSIGKFKVGKSNWCKFHDPL